MATKITAAKILAEVTPVSSDESKRVHEEAVELFETAARSALRIIQNLESESKKGGGQKGK